MLSRILQYGDLLLPHKSWLNRQLDVSFHFLLQGRCERTMQDVVERIWDFIDDFNLNSILKFLKDNIVGTVVIVSLLFWVPISCLISYVDRKRAEKVTFDNRIGCPT